VIEIGSPPTYEVETKVMLPIYEGGMYREVSSMPVTTITLPLNRNVVSDTERLYRILVSAWANWISGVAGAPTRIIADAKLQFLSVDQHVKEVFDITLHWNHPHELAFDIWSKEIEQVRLTLLAPSFPYDLEIDLAIRGVAVYFTRARQGVVSAKGGVKVG